MFCRVGWPQKPSGRQTFGGRGLDGTRGIAGYPRPAAGKPPSCQLSSGGSDPAAWDSAFHTLCAQGRPRPRPPLGSASLLSCLTGQCGTWTVDLPWVLWVPELCIGRCSGEKPVPRAWHGWDFLGALGCLLASWRQGFPVCSWLCFWENECFSVSSRALNDLA